MITFDAHIQLEKKLNDAWERENPTLLNGELVAAEMNDGSIKLKIGDGKTSYRSLSFINISNPVEVNVPTKISELENDANYISYDEKFNEVSLPRGVTISSGDGLNIHTNMLMDIKADVLQLSDHGSGAILQFTHGDAAKIIGDLHVDEPMTDNSVVNKNYVDKQIAKLREIVLNR